MLVVACRDIRLMENGCVERKKGLVGRVQGRVECYECHRERRLKKVGAYGGSLPFIGKSEEKMGMVGAKDCVCSKFESQIRALRI